MKTVLLTFAGAMMALILFFVILPLTIIMMFAPASETTNTPDGNIVLSLDLRTPYSDRSPTDGPGVLFELDGFIDILSKLDAAAEDPDVAAVIIRSSEMGIGSSRAEELRAAISKLQDKGKFVLGHSQGFFVGSASSYRSISSADEIWMQAGSEFNVPGVSLESLFFKGLLEKIGVTPEIMAFYEFKNAPNAYTQDGFTEAHELAMRELGEHMWSQTLTDILDDRASNFESADILRATLEDSPYGADAAKELGLIDELGWPEDAERSLEERFDGEILDITAYYPSSQRGSAIALIAAEGPVITGASGGNPFDLGAENTIASDTVAEHIYRAGEDEDVQAIVFRVDSPGGSPTASDQIWRAIEYVQAEKNKPVIVSMGSLAASGGYYISMGADHIVASPSTITGSIGVFGGRFAIAEGLGKIGITSDSIEIGGPYASAYTSVNPLTNEQRDKMYDSLKRTYDRFIALAAEGRGMTPEELHERAKGRVWTGADALEQGLVDELGGLISAIDAAKRIANIDEDEDVRIIRMDSMENPLQQMFGISSGDANARTRILSAIGQLTGDQRIQAAIAQSEGLHREPTQAAIAPIVEK